MRTSLFFIAMAIGDLSPKKRDSSVSDSEIGGFYCFFIIIFLMMDIMDIVK